ncbi:MAG TPA: T9SS type A sorting domain-containing protein [bacterium]|nr:T9SS type A sorting domain-containing protein [bacterium]
MKSLSLYVLLILFVSSVHAEVQIGPEYGTKFEFSVAGNFSLYGNIGSDTESPIWSPDGKWIACTDAGSSIIHIIPAEGGENIRIYSIDEIMEANENVISAHIYYLNFTADSREITFQADIIDTTRGGKKIEVGGGAYRYSCSIPQIMSVNIYTGELRTIIDGGYHPNWSQDGRYLIYVNFDPGTWILDVQSEYNGVPAIYDTETEETRYLSDEGITDTASLDGRYSNNKYHFPVISPDGYYLIFDKTVDGAGQLFRIPFEGIESEQLTFFEARDDYDWECKGTKFSPDGQWVVFTKYKLPLLYKIDTGEIFYLFSGEMCEDSGFFLPEEPVWGAWFASWSPVGDKLCYTLYLVNDGVFVGSYIYIFDFDPDKYIDDGVVMVESDKPSGFALLGNYPNPFNPATTIEFSIPEAGFVKLEIYNMMGQKIRELVSREMTPGVHSVLWDGCDKNGNQVSSGIYFSHLSMGNQTTINRMMLVK